MTNFVVRNDLVDALDVLSTVAGDNQNVNSALSFYFERNAREVDMNFTPIWCLHVNVLSPLFHQVQIPAKQTVIIRVWRALHSNPYNPGLTGLLTKMLTFGAWVAEIPPQTIVLLSRLSSSGLLPRSVVSPS
jgi:hypothetical protein